MPILRINDNVEFCRYLATSPDIHVMSGRGDDLKGTEYANTGVLEKLGLAADDTLLDIGCGDGCLLRMAEGRVSERVGIVPTAEERSKLKIVFPDVQFLVGMVQRLPLDSASFSKVVCNGVLLLLNGDDAAISALKEIARVAKPGARLWLGEIPSANELPHFKVYRGNSILGFLQHELRRKGIRPFLSSVRSVGSAFLGRQTLLLNSASIFHASPEKFIGMAAHVGLHLETYFKYQRLDRSGNIIESPFRYNYIFTKPIVCG